MSGPEGATGDGNNVEVVYRLASEAVARARSGEGPTFLEFKTYRWREHCGPNYDNHLGYRTEAEFLEWRQRCPVERYQFSLLQDGILSPQDVAKFQQDIHREIQGAFDYAKASPFPTEDQLFAGVYADTMEP